MGIAIPGTHANNYYSDASLYGDYQFLTLEEVVKTFMATYVGVGKICENVRSSDVSFHAGRALQEFNYDTLRSIKSQEVTLNLLRLLRQVVLVLFAIFDLCRKSIVRIFLAVLD